MEAGWKPCSRTLRRQPNERTAMQPFTLRRWLLLAAATLSMVAGTSSALAAPFLPGSDSERRRSTGWRPRPRVRRRGRAAGVSRRDRRVRDRYGQRAVAEALSQT